MKKKSDSCAGAILKSYDLSTTVHHFFLPLEQISEENLVAEV